jgi:hypothetical protein
MVSAGAPAHTPFCAGGAYGPLLSGCLRPSRRQGRGDRRRGVPLVFLCFAPRRFARSSRPFRRVMPKYRCQRLSELRWQQLEMWRLVASRAACLVSSHCRLSSATRADGRRPLPGADLLRPHRQGWRPMTTAPRADAK